MSKAIQRFSLDVTHPDVQATVRIVQGDDNRQWRFTFTKAGEPFDLPPRCTAMLVGTKPDDTVLQNGLVVQGNEAIYDFGAADPTNHVEQISTVPGSFEIQIILFDEAGNILHLPRMWVVVYASSYTAALVAESESQFGAIKELIERLVEAEGQAEALKKLVTTQGTVTISTTQWTNTTPYRADVFMPGDVFGKGCVVLFLPEDDATKEAAGKAVLSMTIDGTFDYNAPSQDYVVIARAESGVVPTIPLNFRYVVLKTDTEDKALVAMIGVDAVGAGTGNDTATGVDESAVRAIINQVVPAWARASTKPTYNKSEVGLGNVDNAKQYSESNPPDYPVDSVNGKTGAVQLKASDVGADPSGTAATKVSDHDTYTGSHSDIRLLLQTLSNRLNAFLDTDDTTLDELSEIVAYIKSNKTLIDSITTSKINVTDIINNLTTNVTNKPLSAAQGVALKKLIDTLSSGKLDASALTAAKLADALGYTPANAANVPTKLSQLTDDSTHRTVTDEEKADWGSRVTKEELEEAVGTGATIPDYWETYLPSKIATIRSLQEAGGKDAFSFVVMTDSHYAQNLGHRGPAIARRIMDECDIKYALYLGDVQNRGVFTTEAETVAELEAANEMFEPLSGRLLQTIGNHDGSWGRYDLNEDGDYADDGESYACQLSPGELYELIFRKLERAGELHFDESGTAYYVDDTSHKIRYIMLNTHCNKWEIMDKKTGAVKYPHIHLYRFTQSQYDFLCKEALVEGLTDAWGIVIGTHIPLAYVEGVTAEFWGGVDGAIDAGDNALMRKMLDAYNNKTMFSDSFEGTATSGSSYKNLASPTSSEWLTGYRLNGSGATVAYAPTVVTNFIPCKSGDVIRIKGLDLTEGTGGYVSAFDADKAVGVYEDMKMPLKPSVYPCVTKNGTYDYTQTVFLGADGETNWAESCEKPIAYARFSGALESTAEDVIITVNEEIVESGSAGYDAVTVEADFTKAKGHIVAAFSGHMHKDLIYATGHPVGAETFPIFTTRSDAAVENDTALQAERVKGTVTEQSFDVVTVDKKNQKIYLTKVGAGYDREVDVPDTVTGAVGGSFPSLTAAEINPRAMIRQIVFFDENKGANVTFDDVYSVFDVDARNNGFIFGLESHASQSTNQDVYISRDGGDTWKVYGSFAIDAPNGVWFTDIFVDERMNVIYMIKTTTGFTMGGNQLCSFTWNGQDWYNSGTLELGNKRWLSNNNSIDVCSSADWTSRAVIFGEYGTTIYGDTYSLYKSTNNGISWKKVLELSGDTGGASLTGEIRHWHTVQVDPYTKNWWATSGDGNSQCRIYRSEDMGETWELMFSGSQRERTCSFVFEQDCIYYGMDSTNNLDETSIKIVKIDRAKLDTDRENCREDVETVDSAFAVYGLSKTFSPDGFIVWSQQEPNASYVKDRYILQFYDYVTKKLYPIARFDTSGIPSSNYIGFYAGARRYNRLSGTVIAKPTTSLQRDKFGHGTSNVSTHIKINLTM